MIRNGFPVCFLCLVLSVFLAAPVAAVDLDLSTWTALTLDLPGGQSGGSWILSDGNTTVTQTVNADPSFYLNNQNNAAYTMNGTWLVSTGSDDDLMGFAFGYQDAGHCYILDWKQSAQNAGGYGFHDEGFVIRKMHGNPGDMVISDYWAHLEGQERYTVLATSFSPTLGWQDNAPYIFTLDFNPGEFTVIVREGEAILWEVTVQDSDYASGQFGFYNNSQAYVQYSGFTQNLSPVCDSGGPYDAYLGEEIVFDGSASNDMDGEVVTWAWDFGDEEVGSGPTPSHLYAELGEYTVTLCVTDDLGDQSCCETTASLTVNVGVESTTWSEIKGSYR